MEPMTKNEGGVITYIGPGCRYDTGEIPAEVGVAGVRALLKRVNAYEGTGLEPEEVTANMEMFAAYRHVCGGLAPEEVEKLVRAQQDGRLVVPCNVGDTVYKIVLATHDEDADGGLTPIPGGRWVIWPIKVAYVSYSIDTLGHMTGFASGEIVINGNVTGADALNFDDFGKTVFLTRAEAEAALKSHNTQKTM